MAPVMPTVPEQHRQSDAYIEAAVKGNDVSAGAAEFSGRSLFTRLAPVRPDSGVHQGLDLRVRPRQSFAEDEAPAWEIGVDGRPHLRVHSKCKTLDEWEAGFLDIALSAPSSEGGKVVLVWQDFQLRKMVAGVDLLTPLGNPKKAAEERPSKVPKLVRDPPVVASSSVQKFKGKLHNRVSRLKGGTGLHGAGNGGTISHCAGMVYVEAAVGSTIRKGVPAADGGVAFASESDSGIVITRSEMKMNAARNRGGVAFAESGSGILIDGGSMMGNRAVNGGVAYSTLTWTNEPSINITGARVVQNTAEYGGVAVSYYSGSIVITGSEMSLNAASKAEARRCDRKEDAGVAYDYESWGMTITESVFTQNRAEENGAVTYSYAGGSVTVDGITAVNNEAVQDGGVFFARVSGNLTISASHLAQNAAKSGGAIVYGSGNSITVMGCNISANVASQGGGAVHAEGTRRISITDSFVLQNSAKEEGGVLKSVATGSLTIRRTLLGDNSAGKGGALHLASTLAVVAECTLSANYGDYAGGAMHLVSGSHASVIDAVASGNQAEMGGAIAVEEDSYLLLRRSNFSGNRASKAGGGIYNFNGTADEKEPCIFRENSAESGGAVATLSARLVLEGSAIEGNSASHGGGVWVGNHSALTLTAVTLRANCAGADGGGVYVASHVAEFAVHECSVEGNNASAYGGGAFLQRPSSASTLRSVHFATNWAGAAGANVYWEHHAHATWPSCKNCTVGSMEAVDDPEADPIMATSATDFWLMQGGAVLGTTTKGESRVSFDPPLTYVAVDAYGNPTWLVSEPIVVAKVEDLEVSLSGSTVATYAPEEGAAFTALVITARPGLDVSLTFEPQQAPTWRSVTVVVELELCAAGERYVEGAERCEECAPATLKLTNSSARCGACDEEGVVCHGGARWTLGSGYWQAALSAGRCAADLAPGSEPWECMFSRVYACAAAAACTSSDTQRTSDGEVAIAAENQCAEGHRSDVVLCGACSPGYEMMYDGACRRCAGSAAQRWGTSAAVAGALMALAAFGARLMFFVTKAQPLESGGRRISRISSVVNRTFARTKKQLYISSLLRILCNHAQLLAQHTIVFDADVFPGVYSGVAAQVTGVVTVSLVRWLRIQCLVAGSVSGPTFREAIGLGPFYLEFLCLTMLPYLVVLPLVAAAAPGLLAAAQLRLRRPLAEGDGRCGCESGQVEMPVSNDAADAAELSADLTVEMTTSDSVVAATELPEDCTASVNRGSSPSPAEASDDATGAPTEPSESRTPPRCDERSGSRDLGLRSDHHGPKWSSMNPTFEIGFVDICDSLDSAHQGTAASLSRGPDHDRLGEVSDGPHMSLELCNEPCSSALPGLRGGQRGQREGSGAADFSGSDFVGLYHPFATFALVFLHPSVSTVCMQLFMCDSIYLEEDEPTAWLRMDLETPCYDVQWFFFMVIAVCVIISYVLGLPLVLISLTNYLHSQKQVKCGDELIYVHQSRLRTVQSQGSDADEEGTVPMVKYIMEDTTTMDGLVEVNPVYPAGYGGRGGIDQMKTRLLHDRRFRSLWVYVIPYRDQCFYWAGCDILIRLSQTSFIVLVQMVSSKYDIVYAIINGVFALTLQCYIQPFKSSRCNMLSALSQLCVSLVICGFIAEEYVNEGGSNAGSLLFGAMLVSYQVLLLAVMCYFIMGEISGFVVEEYAHLSEASGSMRRPTVVGMVVGIGGDAVKKVQHAVSDRLKPHGRSSEINCVDTGGRYDQ
ncbi:hypothetical protein CYMTET_26181 [Cymbomonas tetramitiformis]|uniref:Right handed beta helix domain-containing protein n=1 Tax=Cymbomonas tetramitiformis TaxID=36881 RepID=A0AAE0FSA6_9CHLO|nr:hypothetical protein CYMTET_26181 [Cymbomonas tetramitiformis]